MKLSLSLVMAVTGLTALTLTTPAQADTFNFDYTTLLAFTGSPIDIDAVLTTDPEMGGTYQVTGITGTATFGGVADTITGLNGSFGGADNVLYPSFPYVDGPGIAFDTANNGAVNVYSDMTTDFASTYIDGTIGSLTVSPATSAVPEPSTYALLGSLGLTGAAFLRRRRTR